jgi:hypothetical protein
MRRSNASRGCELFYGVREVSEISDERGELTRAELVDENVERSTVPGSSKIERPLGLSFCTSPMVRVAFET